MIKLANSDVGFAISKWIRYIFKIYGYNIIIISLGVYIFSIFFQLCQFGVCSCRKVDSQQKKIKIDLEIKINHLTKREEGKAREALIVDS